MNNQLRLIAELSQIKPISQDRLNLIKTLKLEIIQEICEKWIDKTMGAQSEIDCLNHRLKAIEEMTSIIELCKT
jgi:hypothetical protein